MSQTQQDEPQIIARLAETREEVEAAQRLRYAVFYEEQKATPSPEMAEARRDFDKFDDIADHLIVLDQAHPKKGIIGTYRLLRSDVAQKNGGFYSASEFDLDSLVAHSNATLELGRSCVLPEYRTRQILQLLWQGIAGYIFDNNIEYMFGCASLPGTDIEAIKLQLSYLYHYHSTDKPYAPRAVDGRHIEMNLIPKDEINAKAVFSSLPPLFKGYLRVGAVIGDGAVIDEQFNTTDVCVVVDTSMLADRYLKHYERTTQKSFEQPTERQESATL